MNTRLAPTLGLLVAAALALTACDSGDGADSPSARTPGTSAPAAQGVGLKTADSSVGTIVTDSAGMVVYMFDSDTQGSGTSACTGGCLSAWPPVSAGSGAPELTGVTGDVGSITATDGTSQLTLNGWPLYYFASDAAPGDMMGQGSGGVWWVLDAGGNPVGK